LHTFSVVDYSLSQTAPRFPNGQDIIRFY